MDSTLIGLPGEIRNQILSYLVPSDSIIEYRCSPTHHQRHQPAHRRCGLGPGWLCLGERATGSQLGILTANRQLSSEFVGLLYNRLFKVDVAEHIFVANTCDWDIIRRFPFAAARWIALEIHVPTNPTALQFRLANITRLNELWGPLHRNISWISFLYDDDDDDDDDDDRRSPEDYTNLSSILEALGATNCLRPLIAGEKVRHIYCKSYTADYLDYRPYQYI